MFGAPSIGQFLAAGLGPQVTDPGQAINVGSARDVQEQYHMGQGALASQAGAARAQIAAQQAATLGELIGGMDFSSLGKKDSSGGSN